VIAEIANTNTYHEHDHNSGGEITMCDFAADAAAAEQLMVGRTLSVARVRELNAKDYFYQMLKDNPARRRPT
jgi:hypothetical protein